MFITLSVSPVPPVTRTVGTVATGITGAWSQSGAGAAGSNRRPGVDASPGMVSFALKRGNLRHRHEKGGVSGLAFVRLPDAGTSAVTTA